MSAKVEAYVRHEGASLRQYVAKIMLANGPVVSLAVLKRLAWELADIVGETYGPTVVHAMLDEARDGFQLDMAPPVAIADEPDNLTLVAHALEGLQTIGDQNRQAIASLVEAVSKLASEVRHGA